MSAQIIAIVPMRHQSERVPGKNYRPLGGRPLYHHIVSSLEACPRIAEVVIDTDSNLIAEDATRSFPAVRIIERPAHLRGGHVSMNDVLLYDLTQLSADYFLQTHSTNPLLRTATITKAIDAFFTSESAHDSLFSVTRLHTRLWNAAGQPINHDPNILLRTQDLPPVFEENSNLYLFTRDGLEQHKSRIGQRPLLFEIDPIEAWDIDEEADFQIVEALYKQKSISLAA